VLAIRAKRDDPTCNPSIRTICRDAAVGHDTACNAIRKFEANELLSVERRRGRANIYHLTIPASGTPSVPDTRKVDGSPNHSGQRNSKGVSVPDSGTQVFRTADPERESLYNPFPMQDEHVEENDSELPY